jgi:hypothetical protein
MEPMTAVLRRWAAEHRAAGRTVQSLQCEAMANRLDALEAERDEVRRLALDRLDRALLAESRSVALEDALRGLAERWGRVAEGGLTAHDAHTMLSEVRALASGTGAGT